MNYMKFIFNNKNMYLLISRLSFIVRAYVCYWTIEQYPIFENTTIQWMF